MTGQIGVGSTHLATVVGPVRPRAWVRAWLVLGQVRWVAATGASQLVLLPLLPGAARGAAGRATEG